MFRCKMHFTCIGKWDERTMGANGSPSSPPPPPIWQWSIIGNVTMQMAIVIRLVIKPHCYVHIVVQWWGWERERGGQHLIASIGGPKLIPFTLTQLSSFLPLVNDILNMTVLLSQLVLLYHHHNETALIRQNGHRWRWKCQWHYTLQ